MDGKDLTSYTHRCGGQNPKAGHCRREDEKDWFKERQTRAIDLKVTQCGGPDAEGDVDEQLKQKAQKTTSINGTKVNRNQEKSPPCLVEAYVPSNTGTGYHTSAGEFMVVSRFYFLIKHTLHITQLRN